MRPGFSPGWVRVWIGGARRGAGLRRAATWWQVHPRWAHHSERASDLGLLQVGNLVPSGAFGFRDNAQIGMTIEVTGFGAAGLSERRQLKGEIKTRTSGTLGYSLPTVEGMSGSPVWTGQDTKSPIVVGVHTRHTTGAYAVRLTKGHVGWIARYR